MQNADTKRANLIRFVLMAIPPVAWAISFSYLFLVANGFRLDWVSNALLPSLVHALVVAIVCAAVWFGYQRNILKTR